MLNLTTVHRKLLLCREENQEDHYSVSCCARGGCVHEQHVLLDGTALPFASHATHPSDMLVFLVLLPDLYLVAAAAAPCSQASHHACVLKGPHGQSLPAHRLRPHHGHAAEPYVSPLAISSCASAPNVSLTHDECRSLPRCGIPE